MEVVMNILNKFLFLGVLGFGGMAMAYNPTHVINFIQYGNCNRSNNNSCDLSNLDFTQPYNAWYAQAYPGPRPDAQIQADTTTLVDMVNALANSGVVVSASGANFDRANMPGINLSNAYLESASFQYTVLRGANLSGANLSQAKFSNAHASHAIFRGANLTQAVFYKAGLDYAVFDHTVLTNADFSGADAYKSSFYEARVDTGNPDSAYPVIFGSVGATVDLDSADFTDAQLPGAVFVGNCNYTTLAGITWPGANTGGCTWIGATH
jgi:uncharacterized protein YjbI with pentapeptide repeats